MLPSIYLRYLWHFSLVLFRFHVCFHHFEEICLFLMKNEKKSKYEIQDVSVQQNNNTTVTHTNGWMPLCSFRVFQIKTLVHCGTKAITTTRPLISVSLRIRTKVIFYLRTRLGNSLAQPFLYTLHRVLHEFYTSLFSVLLHISPPFLNFSLDTITSNTNVYCTRRW
jgi:hypothetical protein